MEVFKKTNFRQFPLWEGVVHLRGLTMNHFNCGVLKGLVFDNFSLWECVVVLKGQTFNKYHCYNNESYTIGIPPNHRYQLCTHIYSLSDQSCQSVYHAKATPQVCL